MAKQKKLNTNLVAFLTVMGMVATVSVVTLIIWQATRRNPEVFERKAQQFETGGDLRKAANSYRQAYIASNEEEQRYLLEAARCVFELGDLANWRALLHAAHVNQPSDPVWLTALLDGFWEFQMLTGRSLGEGMEQLRRDYAASLLEVQPDNVLALVSHARAEWALGAPGETGAADDEVRRAVELAPTEPRVAITRVMLHERESRTALRAAQTRGATRDELAEMSENGLRERFEILAAAAEQRTDSPPLLVRLEYVAEEYARLLISRQRESEAGEVLARCRPILTSGLEENPDDADLPLAMAQHLRLSLGLDYDDLSHEQREERMAEIARYASDAQERDPAVFSAYAIQAEMARMSAGPDPDQPRPLSERYSAALDIFEQAAQDTLMLWQENIRAQYTEARRLRMLHDALATAVDYFERSADRAARAAILERAQVFLDDAQTKYPDQAVTHYMMGEFARIQEDVRAAITAFEAAQQKAQSFQAPPPIYWGTLGITKLPIEHLAELYLKEGQIGEAQRNALQGMQLYEQGLGRTPPLGLIQTTAEILSRLDRLPQAIEVLERYQPSYPNDDRLATALAVARARAGQTERAQEQVEALTGGDLVSQYRRAQILLAQDDLVAAEQTLQNMLDTFEMEDAQRNLTVDTLARTRLRMARKFVQNDDHTAAEQVLHGLIEDPLPADGRIREALTLYVQVMIDADRHSPGREYLAQLDQNPPRPNMQRVLRQHTLFLSEEDTQARDEQMLALIAENEDAQARVQEFYSFYISRDEFGKAAPYLAELRELDPNNTSYTEREFNLQLVLEDFDAAANLLVELSQYDDGRGLDRAGGATYRAQLALARDGAEGAETAITEYQTALRELPKDADLEVELGRAFLLANRMTEGIEALERAVALNPHQFEARRLLILAYERRANEAFEEDERARYEAKITEHLDVARKLWPREPEVLAAVQRTREREAPLTAITTARAAWEAAPEDPQKANALGRLYARVASTLSGDPSAEARTQLEQADSFFHAALDTLTEMPQLQLARSASAFYLGAGQIDTGEQVLREVLDQQTGGFKVRAQLLLATYLSEAGVVDAAEREFQEAQRMAHAEVVEPEERAMLDRQVGLAFIEFYKRNDLNAQVVEVCRWLLDRLGPTSEGIRSVRLQLIEGLLTTDALTDAESEIEQYLRDFGAQDLGGLMARAQLRLQRNRRMAAMEDLDQILRLDPKQVWARYTRGTLAAQRGQHDRALEDLLEARSLIRSPNMLFEVHDRLARVYARTGQLDLAERELRAQLDMLGDAEQSAAARQQVIAKIVRLLYVQGKQFDRAQQLISEYMERYPSEATWPYELGALFESRAQSLEAQAARATAQNDTRRAGELKQQARDSYEAAAPYFQRAAERAGQANPRALDTSTVARVRVLTNADRAREALDVIANYPLPRLSAAAQVEAAKALMAVGDDSAAQARWRNALTDTVQRSSSLAGVVLNQMRAAMIDAHGSEDGNARIEALLRELNDGVPTSSPASLRLRLLLASNLANRGANESAIPMLRDLVAEAAPRTSERVEAMLLLARAQDEAGDTAAAVQTYRDLLAQMPRHIIAMNNLAYLLVTGDGDLYRPQEARTYAERLWPLVSGDPAGAVILDTVGWVFFKNEDYDLAAAALEESLGLDDESNPTTYLHLGQVYLAQHRDVEAERVLSRGLTLAREGAGRDADELIPQFEAELAKTR